MADYIPISGAFVQLRVPKYPTAKQAEIIARRVEWLQSNPGRAYPLELRQDIIETKLYPAKDPTWKKWIAHFRELNSDGSPKDALVQMTAFTPLAAAAEIKSELTEESSDEVPCKLVIDEGNEQPVLPKCEQMASASNAMLEPPRMSVVKQSEPQMPTKENETPKGKCQRQQKACETNKRNDGLGFRIRNNDPSLKLIPGTGLMVRVAANGKQIPAVWWCKECERVIGNRSVHLKGKHNEEFRKVRRDYANSRNATK